MKDQKNYQLSTSVRDGVVEIIITGEITKSSIDMLRPEVITILRENNARALLWENRILNGPREIIDAYFRVRTIPLDVKALPVAIVESSGDQGFQSFYETTSANTGQSMKYFTNVEAARAWLKSRLEKTAK